jgi:hypothetical protein
MEPGLARETPTSKSEPESRPALKSYATPRLTRHGKLPALTLGGS